MEAYVDDHTQSQASPDKPDARPIQPLAAQPGAKCPAKRWGTRAGVAVFAFFLIKGLAWLVVPAAVAAFAMRGGD